MKDDDGLEFTKAIAPALRELIAKQPPREGDYTLMLHGVKVAKDNVEVARVTLIENRTDAEYAAWEERAKVAVTALSDDERKRRLIDCDYAPYPIDAQHWGIMGYSGAIGPCDLTSERAAEDHILIHVRGEFDDA